MEADKTKYLKSSSPISGEQSHEADLKRLVEILRRLGVPVKLDETGQSGAE